MEYMEYRAYCTKQGQEFTLCKFWIDENGDVDEDNLPSKKPLAELLQALRIYEVHVEFTGRVEDEE
jgi:hypothetical protein